jgi:hypothetical protein
MSCSKVTRYRSTSGTFFDEQLADHGVDADDRRVQLGEAHDDESAEDAGMRSG